MERPVKRVRLAGEGPKIGAAVHEELRYKPLPGTKGWTRVLSLNPAQDGQSPLHGFLPVVNVTPSEDTQLAESESYEALSYVWGSDEKPCTISLGETVVRIGANLDSALRAFRLQDQTRRLWVDALCINQTDNLERTQQVAMMAEIYRRATRTLAWLGDDPADRASGRVMEFISWHLLQPRWSVTHKFPPSKRHRSIRAFIDPFGPSFDNAVESYHELTGRSMSARMLEEFCSKEYFSRMWVVQEMAVATEAELWCGDSKILRDELSAAMLEILAQDSPFKITDPIMRLLNYTTTIPGSIGMLEMLEKYRDFRCRDDRDRIAALLWSFPVSLARGLVVDYSSSVNENYKRLATTMCRSDVSSIEYMLTSAARRCHGSDPDLPSWVPDWRVSPRNGSAVVLPHRHRRRQTTDGEASKITLCRYSLSVMNSAVMYMDQAILRFPLNGVWTKNAVVQAVDSMVLESGDVVLGGAAFLEQTDSTSSAYDCWGRGLIVLRPVTNCPVLWKLIGALRGVEELRDHRSSYQNGWEHWLSAAQKPGGIRAVNTGGHDYLEFNLV